ncbi:hypothetical protein CEXT_189191, partial [Caerostris extrusa]
MPLITNGSFLKPQLCIFTIFNLQLTTPEELIICCLHFNHLKHSPCLPGFPVTLLTSHPRSNVNLIATDFAYNDIVVFVVRGQDLQFVELTLYKTILLPCSLSNQ